MILYYIQHIDVFISKNLCISDTSVDGMPKSMYRLPGLLPLPLHGAAGRRALRSGRHGRGGPKNPAEDGGTL